ncbi:MAG: hypothetical protein ACREQA_07020 [Candidatus Binatia bacterium]
MTRAILTFILIFSLATKAFSAACPDLSGRYRLRGEDGYVIIDIKQMNCTSLEVSRESNYLGQITRTKLLIKSDGIFRWVYGGLYAAKEAYMIAGHFIGDGFEIRSIPAFSSKSKKGAMSLVEVYSTDSQGNLRLTHKSYDAAGNLKSESTVVAVRV